jgi:ribosomal protein S18 acetylase RimI-like enzyme
MKEGKVIKTIQNNGFIFRYPRWQDVPAYVDMCNILHRERVMAYHALTDFAKGCERLSGILVGLETEQRSHLLIETDGQIIGEGSMQVGTAHQTGTLGIKIIGKYRRRGLGTEMMLLLESEAQKLGLQRIYLHVWGLNKPAFQLYLKVGYREIGRLPNWYHTQDGAGNNIYSDLIEMIKDLEP